AAEMGAQTDEVVREIESRFADYDWPGNLRELRNAVARYVALGDDWQPPSRSAPPGSPPPPGTSAPGAVGGADWMDAIVASKRAYPLARRRTIEEFQRRYVERMLAEHGGNVTQAARASGLGLRYFRVVKARRQRNP